MTITWEWPYGEPIGAELGGGPVDFTNVSYGVTTILTPPHAAGLAEGLLTFSSTEGGGFGFTYYAAPAVTGISPSAGPEGGGTAVTITGSGFTGASAVMFGSTAASGLTVTSDNQIIATAPAASAAGPVDITVTTPGGTSTTSPADQYTYLPAPAITGVAPAVGSTSGGAVVTITGSGFTGASAVMFGSTGASGFTVDSDGQITATAPAASAAGPVDITVTTLGGTSTTSPADQFSYLAGPVVTGLAPAAGPTAGGTTVTITGSGFTGATSVTFGTAAATGVSVVSGTEITAVSPAHAKGNVSVRVTTPSGESQRTGNEFSYDPVPKITAISPASGPLTGGTTVTITGSGFTGASAVMFGTVPAASFTVVSATEITAVSPAHSKGKVRISVTTPGGVTRAVAADEFVYSAG